MVVSQAGQMALCGMSDWPAEILRQKKSMRFLDLTVERGKVDGEIIGLVTTSLA